MSPWHAGAAMLKSEETTRIRSFHWHKADGNLFYLTTEHFVQMDVKPAHTGLLIFKTSKPERR